MGSAIDLFTDVLDNEQPKKFDHLVAHYLVHSYLYYILDTSIIEDSKYDEICRELLENFEGIEHQHKHLLDVEALKAGSGFQLKDSDYPLIVKETAKMLLCEVNREKYFPGMSISV